LVSQISNTFVDGQRKSVLAANTFLVDTRNFEAGILTTEPALVESKITSYYKLNTQK